MPCPGVSYLKEAGSLASRAATRVVTALVANALVITALVVTALVVTAPAFGLSDLSIRISLQCL